MVPQLGNRLPTGPGSRGGRWQDPEFRRAYYREWREAHSRGDQHELEEGYRLCACECGCAEHVPVVCGFCSEGTHEGPDAK